MTEERDPLALTLVLPLTPFGPVVIVVEFEPPALPVTTRHGLPLTTAVPFGPAVTATLSASAGAVTVRKPIKTAPVWMRMISSKLLQHAAPGREPRAVPGGLNQINALPVVRVSTLKSHLSRRCCQRCRNPRRCRIEAALGLLVAMAFPGHTGAQPS